MADETVEKKQHERSATVDRVGRSYCTITCPFCRTNCIAYIWSLAGCGKRCPECKALHGNYGFSVRKLKAPKPAKEKKTDGN